MYTLSVIVLKNNFLQDLLEHESERKKICVLLKMCGIHPKTSSHAHEFPFVFGCVFVCVHVCFSFELDLNIQNRRTLRLVLDVVHIFVSVCIHVCNRVYL